MSATVEKLKQEILNWDKSSSGSYSKELEKVSSSLKSKEAAKKGSSVTASDTDSAPKKSAIQAQKDAAEFGTVDIQRQKDQEEFSDDADTPSESKIRADAAKRRMELYQNSEEKRKNAEKRLQDQFANQLLYGITDSSEVLFEEDPKEKELQAEIDYWENKANQEEDSKLFESNMQLIQSLDDTERAAFEKYANNSTFVNTEDVEAYKALKEKYGDKLDDLRHTYQRDKEERAAREVAEKTAAKMDHGGLVGDTLRNVASVGANLIGAVTGTAARINEMVNGTGPYKTATQYTYGDIPSVYGQTVRNKTTEEILDGQQVDLGDGVSGRELGAMAYQGVMGTADTGARLLASGGNPFIAAGMAAAQTFSSTVQEATEQGASPQQAYTLAAVNAGIEAATEKLPLDNLLDIAKGGAKPAIKTVVNVLKQAGIEVLEEEASLIGTTLAEAAILREKSSYQQMVGKAVVQGVPFEQAKAEADRALLEEAKQTAFVSGFSGLLSAGGAEIRTARMGGTQAVQQPTAVQQEQTPIQTEQAAQPSRAAQEQTASKTELQRVTDSMTETITGMANSEQGVSQAEPATNAVSNPIDSYPPEKQKTIRSYLQSVDQGIKDFVQRVKSGDKTFKRQKISDVSDRAVQDISNVLGVDARGYTHNINTGGVQHIINRHGANGEHDNTMSSDDDISRIGWVLENYDNVELVTENGKQVFSKEFKDANNNPAPQIRFVKKIDGSYYVVEAACENKYKKLWVQSAYLRKNNGDVTQVSTADPSASHATNAQGELASPSPVNTIAEKAPKVNGNMGSAQQTDTQGQSAEGGQNKDFRDSNTFMNSGLRSENPNIREGYRQDLKANPDAAKYAVKHNADTLAEANRRVSTPEAAGTALEDLLSRTNWTAEDVATSTLLLDQVMASGDRNAIEKLSQLRQQRKDVLSNYGQTIQAVTIGNETMHDAASPATAVDTFHTNLDSMKEGETTYNPRSGVDFETWKNNIKKEVDNIGIAIAMVEDGNSDEMRNIIRQIAKARKTTAWFGHSDRVTTVAQNVLKKLEFDDLKKIANTQVAAMADDYRRRSMGEVVSAIRKQSMLTSLKTFARNIGGNTAAGFADAVSESGAGQMADALLSHFTGKRTIGNDLFRAKEYAGAAKEAAQFAALCVELNIPIETDIDSSFEVASGKGSNEKYVGRTFRATGNPAMRALYGYQKYMSYALEVTDKVFEGGSNAAVQESLNRLRNSNLTEEDVETLGQFTANKRTFKNATWEQDGKTKGSALARKGSALKNETGILGDVAAPFVNVPMNVAQTGIDYTAGIGKGLGEMISIIKDAKAGKTIAVERQRQAASDFGRGVTGTAMIAMFASAAAMGALKASDGGNWDKEALAQAEGRSGAQINWSALDRGMQGKSAEWQTTDVITSLDFLEPFNTQMYLGYEIANTEDMNLLKYSGATIKSVWQSLMDSPVMTGLQEIADTIKDFSEAEKPDDVVNAAAGYVGDVGTSFIPQIVRQTAQEMDGYYRDTRGENAVESVVNSFKAALPWASQTLPVKYSGLGEAQQRGTAVETFLDPTATKEYKKNDVTAYLDTLSEKTGDESIYPRRQAPLRIEVRDQEITLDGQMRETYQKTYGENVNALYSGLINNAGFQNLPADVQSDAFAKAKEYATALAKASVSDYRDAPTESTEELVRNIISGTVETGITKAFSGLSDNWKYDEDTAQSVEALDAAYQNYQAMGSEEQKAFYEDASGRVKYFIDSKKDGMSTETFTEMYRQYRDIDGKDLSVKDKAQEWSYALEKAVDAGTITERQKDTMKGNMQFYYDFPAETEKFDEMIETGVPTDVADMVIYTINNVQGTGKDGKVQEIDKRGAIANLEGVDEATKDTIMHAYMTDYDPNAETAQTTELKYDYIRDVMGMSAEEYADAYRVNLEGGKWKTQAQKISQEIGCSYNTAYELVLVFEGRKKDQLINWYNRK